MPAVPDEPQEQRRQRPLSHYLPYQGRYPFFAAFLLAITLVNLYWFVQDLKTHPMNVTTTVCQGIIVLAVLVMSSVF
jgi:hypothetical protein